ncbi:MAG: hypothetical protein JWO60_1095, partial [Frankiales bacterium]|nr:hypothetical protein [Frankiales bacterium]
RSGGDPRGAGPGAARSGGGRPPAGDRTYDPRREARRQLARVPLPDDVTPALLDPEVRKSLLTLSRDTADTVARHLVMTGRLLDEDPQRALVHARAAGSLAGRVADVREATGVAAYTAGEWAEALSELRAARRMSGSPEHLAVMADCERALGRPERALAVLDDPDVARLEQATRVELVIVVAGARRDLGQADAAVLLLQGPAKATTARRPWAARLWYAYADALLDAGREEQAREWFAKAADVDEDGQTDAVERLLALDGVLFDDDDDPADDDQAGTARTGSDQVDQLGEDEELEPGDAALSTEALRELVAGIAPLQGPAAGEPQRPAVQGELPDAADRVSQEAYEAEAAVEVAERQASVTATSPFGRLEPEAVPAVRAPAAVPVVAFVPPTDGDDAELPAGLGDPAELPTSDEG